LHKNSSVGVRTHFINGRISAWHPLKMHQHHFLAKMPAEFDRSCSSQAMLLTSA